MSTTHHAAVIVGCRIPYSELFVKSRVRICSHRIPGESLDVNLSFDKFCTECGNKLWKTVKEPIAQYDQTGETLCGFRVFAWSVDRDYAYVSDLFSEVDNKSDVEPEPITLDNMSFVKDRIKSLLEAIGLWNENEFGIWPVLWYV